MGGFVSRMGTALSAPRHPAGATAPWAGGWPTPGRIQGPGTKNASGTYFGSKGRGPAVYMRFDLSRGSGPSDACDAASCSTDSVSTRLPKPGRHRTHGAKLWLNWTTHGERAAFGELGVLRGEPWTRVDCEFSCAWTGESTTSSLPTIQREQQALGQAVERRSTPAGRRSGAANDLVERDHHVDALTTTSAPSDNDAPPTNDRAHRHRPRLDCHRALDKTRALDTTAPSTTEPRPRTTPTNIASSTPYTDENPNLCWVARWGGDICSSPTNWGRRLEP